MPGSSRVGALFEADRTLAALEIAQDQPIDVFDAIARMGLELVFADLDHLLGAIVPHGNGGVLITSKRGTAIQRYTAAHEIGHWVLHRDQLNMDGETEILGPAPSERERQAQMFAAYFLMPPPLVTKAVERYGLRRGDVTPAQVYLVSRYLDVSFEATARRLQTHKILSAHEVSSLVQLGRLTALKQAFGGRRPADGNADLWDPNDPPELDAEEPGHLVVEERDEVVITLPENRSSGWQWLTPSDLAAVTRTRRRSRPKPPAATAHRQGEPSKDLDSPLTQRPDSRGRSQAEVRAALALIPTTTGPPSSQPEVGDLGQIEIVENDFSNLGEPATARARASLRRSVVTGAPASPTEEAPRVGGIGLRTVVLRCTDVGHAAFQLHYAHAFDPTAEPVAVYELTVDVRATPLHAYRRRVLATDIEARIDGDPADDAVFEVVAS